MTIHCLGEFSMPARLFVRSINCLAVAALLSAAVLPVKAADTVTVSGLSLVNKGLVGVGRMPADLRDQFGETVGSGSGLAVDPGSWTRAAEGYHGVFYMLPDRGYNITGTTDFRARLYKLAIVVNPAADPAALPIEARQKAVNATLTETILLKDAAGQPLTGLDPAQGGVRPASDSFPPMPQASTGAISLDSEAIVRMPDGSFFISDEYGPYIYRFSAEGRMLSAIRPPDAFIPQRNGKDHFSSNNPGPGADVPKPENPDTGRQNNQGFEGLALTPGGRFLVAVLQSATRQDGGTSPETRQYTRMLYYDISNLDRPKLVREHVVPLPVFENAEGKRRIAAQSELLALDETHFLLLCRDTSAGYGMGSAVSRYRKIEILDTSKATNIVGSKYDGLAPVAPKGELEDGVTPVTLTPFIDINDNTQLNKFGLRNGDPNDRNNLGEKWEGMALLPALDPENPRDFFLFISNDNDFITQDGFQVDANYQDQSGADVDTIFLVYRVTLPDFSK
jgi:hypothetical protein